MGGLQAEQKESNRFLHACRKMWMEESLSGRHILIVGTLNSACIWLDEITIRPIIFHRVPLAKS